MAALGTNVYPSKEEFAQRGHEIYEPRVRSQVETDNYGRIVAIDIRTGAFEILPPLPGWRDRSVFISRQGKISFYHYDFIAQALSKLSRGFDRDLKDVQAMYEQKLFSLTELQNCFEAIAPEFIRFPSIDPDV